MIRLSVHHCHDQATQRTAFSFLVPPGWHAQSGVQWNPQFLLKPVTPAAMAQAPDNSAWMALLPNGVFSWVDSGRMREGAMDYGAPIMRPRPAADLLLGAFPSLRPGIANLRLVHVEPEPAPPWASQKIRQVLPGDDSIRATLEYTLAGRACREIVSLVSHVGDPTPMPTMWGIEQVRYWYAFPALSVGATIDRWDEHAKTLDAIRQTFRIEPSWLQAVEVMLTQISNNALQQQQSWFAAQQSGHRAQVAMGDQLVHMGQDLSNAMDNIVMGGWEQRNQAYDRIYDNQHLATMGVSLYNDPSMSTPVELPYGYQGVWGDGQGDYVLSEDPSYDPNVGAGGPGPTWQRLEKVGP